MSGVNSELQIVNEFIQTLKSATKKITILSKYLKILFHMLSKPFSGLRFIFLFFMSFGFIYNPVQAQTATDTDIKAALILNFLRYISPVIRKTTDTITLGKYGEEKFMVQSLKKIEFQNVRGKVIKLVNFNKNSDFTRFDAIYVFKENNIDIQRIFKNVRNLPIVLISDGYNDPREIMVNFIQQGNGKIQFEINSQNLREANLEVSPKLLLLGGTELDIRELYNVTEKSLSTEREKSEEYERELESKKQEISFLNSQMNSFYGRIDSLKDIIVFQIDNIHKQKSNIDSMNMEVIGLSEVAKQRQRIIDSSNYSISSKNNLIYALDIRLEQEQQKLENTGRQYNNLKGEIENKENMLKKQDLKITNQKIAIFIFLVFVVLLAIFVVLIYNNYKTKKFQNEELAKRNEKINLQKAQMQKQAEKLQHAIYEMEIQKDRTESTLKKLKDAQSQLVIAEKMASLGQLTAGIAHEINNPINFISSSVEGLRYVLSDMKHLLTEYDKISILKDDENIAKLKQEFEYDELIIGFDELTANIKLGVDKTKEIVNSLRLFSRIDEVSYSRVDINKTIDSVLILIGKQFSDRIRITKDYQNIQEVECNAGQIFQVFLNILVNAIQSIKNEGIIKISSQLSNKNNKNQVQISISDNGIGMSKDVMGKIFEPFFTTKEAGQGIGLGLSITYSIINKLGGCIEVESEINKGTTFKIYIPINVTEVTQNP